MNAIALICTIILAASLLGCNDRTDDLEESEDVPPSEIILAENYRWQLIERPEGCVIRAVESGREESIELDPDDYRDLTFDTSNLHLLGEDYSYSVYTPFSDTSSGVVWFGSRKSQIEDFGDGSYLAHSSTRIDYVFDASGDVIRTAHEIVPMENFLLLYDNSGRSFQVMSQDFTISDGTFDLASLTPDGRLVIGNRFNSTWCMADKMSDNLKFHTVETLIGIEEFGVIGKENGVLYLYDFDGNVLADYGQWDTEAPLSWEFRPQGMLGAPGGYFFRFGDNSNDWLYFSEEKYGPVSEYAVVENERFVLTYGENGWQVWNRFVQTLEDTPPILGVIPRYDDGTFSQAIIVESDEKLDFDLGKFLTAVPSPAQIVGDCVISDGQLYDGSLNRLGGARGKIVRAEPLLEGGEIHIDGGGYFLRYYISHEFPDFNSSNILSIATPETEPFHYLNASALAKDGDQLSTIDLYGIDISNNGRCYIHSITNPVTLTESWNGYTLIFSGQAGWVMKDDEVLLSGYGSFVPQGDNLAFVPSFLQFPGKLYDADLNPIDNEVFFNNVPEGAPIEYDPTHE